jgi:hypothetical protein
MYNENNDADGYTRGRHTRSRNSRNNEQAAQMNSYTYSGCPERVFGELPIPKWVTYLPLPTYLYIHYIYIYSISSSININISISSNIRSSISISVSISGDSIGSISGGIRGSGSINGMTQIPH